ncbi:hypothetical protein [Planococcus halotolerans]|uniref:Uncharacterized protein n=1 Tax=Planococcus halotolerans TaxID=2233542 RepID=A0A365L164_9BACL|nr:hypothetical protein [Planococcus halotolerans]QHJ71073.1 hypothetical protein DNR44_010810 [Planococcus halotolerans]RAZ79166.1 hypothetical protein DP120_05985 [Planococcus halotolerans]
MFENWREFKTAFNKGDDAENACASCGLEDFDLLCKEKDDEGLLSAIFICKNCGIQKKMDYREIEMN